MSGIVLEMQQKNAANDYSGMFIDQIGNVYRYNHVLDNMDQRARLEKSQLITRLGAEGFSYLNRLVQEYLKTNPPMASPDDVMNGDWYYFAFRNFWGPQATMMYSVTERQQPAVAKQIMNYMSKIENMVSRIHHVNTKIGESFTIELQGCTVCGYTWDLEYDHATLKHLNTITSCDVDLRPGQSCELTEVFTSLAKGNYTITGYFYRPWEIATEGRGEPTYWFVYVT